MTALLDTETDVLHPPAAWFTKPDWLGPLQKLTIVTDGPEAGRVAGYLAPWNQCILDGGNDCWTVPPSPTRYANIQQGDTLTAEGDLIQTANLGGNVNHARATLGFSGAMKHYEHTASQLMRVIYGEDEHGVYFAGVAWPEILNSPRDVAMIRASGTSGDWRLRREFGAYDLSGAQLVNQPGFPLMRKGGPRPAALRIDDPSGEYPPVFLAGLDGVALLDGEYDETDEECETCGTPLGLAQRVADLEAIFAALDGDDRIRDVVEMLDAAMAGLGSLPRLLTRVAALEDVTVLETLGERLSDVEAVVAAVAQRPPFHLSVKRNEHLPEDDPRRLLISDIIEER